MERNNTSITAVVALIVAVIALVVAWIAYNRAGADLEEQIAAQLEDATQEAAQQAEIVSARLEARSRLISLRGRLEADENYEEGAQELRDIKADLEGAYQNASSEVRQGLPEIREGFDTAERALRSGTAEALDAIGDLTTFLEQDVRTEEQ